MQTKILTLTLALLLIFTLPVLAGVDLGVTQDLVGDNHLRVDVESFYFSAPLGGEINSFSTGFKLGTVVTNAYLMAGVNFEKDLSYMTVESTTFGLGYPIRWDPVVIRGELKVNAPEWANVNNWKYDATVGFQFNWGDLFETQEVSE